MSDSNATDVATVQWPKKTGEFKNHHMDSSRWNQVQIRDDDIVIGTWAKSGTTWMQQIVGQLLFNGEHVKGVMDMCPWIDLRIAPLQDVLDMIEAQTHRRFLKTHLPADALDISPKAKYIYIARDGRDALWSWHNHHSEYSEWAFEAFNNTPGRVGPPVEKAKPDVVEYFRDWLHKDGYPMHPFFSNIQSWWNIKDLPNVKLMHFANMKADLAGSIREVAEFLDIDVDESKWQTIVEHCTFDYMKAHADDLTPLLDNVLKGGPQAFIHKGTNGRWRDVLSERDVKDYETIAARELSPDCARWLAGEH